MTEYEYLELAFDYTESIASSALNIATVFFAYVVAAYFVGEKLPKALACFLTVTYSLFLLGPFIGIYSRIYLIHQIAAQYRIAYPDGAFFRNTAGHFVSLSIAFVPPLIAWCGSIVYMHLHVRRSTG
jgi:hypothetical protein